MDKVTDWSVLWRQLVETQERYLQIAPDSSRSEDDRWRGRAREFDTHSKRRGSASDPLQDFVIAQIDADATVLDIGAGTGRWAVVLAQRARRVTAVEPSAAMIEVQREKITAHGLSNIAIVQGFWPAVAVEQHDVTLCSHAMYFSADLPAFINKMIAVTRRACYLVLRVPAPDSLMAEASLRIWGHPYDSPNFQVAYNVLLQIGLCPNVLVDHTLWQPWSSPSPAAALAKMKLRFGLGEDSPHDDYLRELLSRHLTLRDGQYVWPQGIFSALVYWNVSNQDDLSGSAS